MGIIAVGSIAIDSIKTPRGEREELLGGSLSHFSTAASFYSDVKLLSVVGKDFPNEYWDFLSEKSIILGVMVDFKENTFRWKGYYTDDFGDVVTISTELNAFKKFVPQIPSVYKKAKKDILFLANIDPKLQKTVLDEFSYLPLKVLDTMEYWIQNSKMELEKLFSLVDGIIINEREAFLLTNEKNLFYAVEKLKSYNFRFIIVKKGGNGISFFMDDKIINLPAFPVRDVVDPTGAGDSFAGAFLSYLDHYGVKNLTIKKIKRALAYAVVVSSFVVEDFGVYGLASKTFNDIKKRFKEYREMVTF
jgi:sugar/nucleoside kinase (ribokinase family)